MVNIFIVESSLNSLGLGKLIVILTVLYKYIRQFYVQNETNIELTLYYMDECMFHFEVIPFTRGLRV